MEPDEDAPAVDGAVLAKLDMEMRGVPANLPSPAELSQSGAVCVVAYARISDLSGKRGTSKRAKGVTNQHTTNYSTARRENLVIVRYYTDNDLSASKDAYRPDFEMMLTHLHKGATPAGYPIQGVVAVDEDRIYKLPAQWQHFIEAFRAAPDRVFADDYGTQDLYSENSEIIGLLGVAIAMGENRKRRSRTRRWHEGQARRGIAHTGGRVFGYEPVQGKPGEIQVVPEEAVVIRKAVAACIAQQSWGTITKIFQESGIPTAKGGQWRDQTVKQIVSNPRNAGLRILGDNNDVYRDEHGELMLGQWEAIITPAEWEKVAGRYRPRNRIGKNKPPKGIVSRVYLGSGLYRCGNLLESGRRCNCVMSGRKNDKGRAKYRYGCRPVTNGGCGGVSVGGEWIDEKISELVLLALEERPAVTAELHWDKESELEAALRRRDEFETRWNHGEIDDERFYRMLPGLDETVNMLRRERATFQKANTVPVDTAAQRRERWYEPVEEGGYDLQQKRSILFAELAAVVIHPVGKGTQNRSLDSFTPVWKEAG
ncbi:recombinase family protein [Nocardia sp. NPDC051756]|uniref:recombinase family protein n=1 Tax=Nocardia sp. NPDC051756 TaxID=3154751 RepID=UPI003420D865